MIGVTEEAPCQNSAKHFQEAPNTPSAKTQTGVWEGKGGGYDLGQTDIAEQRMGERPMAETDLIGRSLRQ